jgi:hypothetical protein
MESINNTNNFNIELTLKSEKKVYKLKNLLKKIIKKLSSKKQINKAIDEEFIQYRTASEDNDFNEMLERRMEAQENLINEQIVGKQEVETIGYCFVENEHGKFYWSSQINQFVAVDRDLIASQYCSTEHQYAVPCY